MNFPPHDLAAEDVHDQVEVEEHACDRPWHPGYIPGPNLAGRAGLLACGRFAPDWRLGPSPVMLLSICAQDAITLPLTCHRAMLQGPHSL
jgi:hypothetical protein